ncbi:MAG: sulfatase-like hydrolase/transferase [Prolixibacteraceae bacterium]|nr:sulfatase-like hydrolase/transferase [Prolixibacteraceae bacterium]
MNAKCRLIFIAVLLFVFDCNNVIGSEIYTELKSHVLKKDELSIGVGTSGDKLFIEQEFKYYAPKSGAVNLAWRIEDYTLEESISWNNNTKLTDGFLYTPMLAHGDTFAIKLKIPVGTTLQYYFWITRNKQGAYQDFWDPQSSGKSTIKAASAIYKEANYSKSEDKKESRILSKGWLILALLIGFYVLIVWVQKTLIAKKEVSSIIEKIIFLGLSLAVFYALARAEIIGINPKAVIHDLSLLAKIIRGSYSDILFIVGFVLLFVFLIFSLKNVRMQKWIYGVFIFFSLFFTLIAFINITTVILLGKPFTYQWLYYSDFLGGKEAKTALQENLSFRIVGNLIAFCLSTFILANVLRSINKLLEVQLRMKYIVYSVFGLGLMVFGVQAFKTKVTWTKGQSENAISTMVYSVFTANSNSSFFSADVPAEMKSFNPAQSTKSEMSYRLLQDYKIKNVLFFILESAGAACFDGFGGTYHLSPNLNKYSSSALIFDQMYAHAPATNRSLVSILGSLHPFLSYKSLTQEDPELVHPTLSSVLKNEGYRTSFFSSADLRFQNCRQFLAHRGFDRIEDFSAIKCSEEFQLESSDYNEGNGIDDICLADRLTTWLDEDTTKNFFSMIWTVQGHYPYFFANEEEDFGVSNYNFNRYLNCLKHNDELVGRVMQSLEDRGLASSTLVVVTGDHGEAFGQHRQYGHGTAIYEENLRVPLYFINANLFHGEHKNDIAGMKDLATTTLSILDVDVPSIWQGRDLLSTDSNEAFYFAPWSDYLFGYRKDNMKYIFNESQNTVEVYDLSTDQNEKTNLFQSVNKDEIARVRTRMAAWVQFQNKYIKEIRKED